MTRRIRLRDRIRYRFDNVMASGPAALIAWLAVVSLLMVMVVAGIVSVAGVDPEPRDYWHRVWAALMRTLDPGTMGDDEGSWAFLFAMLTVTLGGIFVVSILIGILTTGLEARLQELRKGRSFVAETGHTVILGWSAQTLTVVEELVLANRTRRGACVVVLAERDAVQMMDDLVARIPRRGRTRIVCRTGSPADPADLAIANPQDASAVIVLPPEEAAEPDARVLKAVLALKHVPQRGREHFHVVAPLHDPRNREVAAIAGGRRLVQVHTGELIARVMAQTCRQPGLSVAIMELLDFGGDDIYFHHEPGLEGCTFGEVLFAFENAVVIGVRAADGQVMLNPPAERVIQREDRIILACSDMDAARRRGGGLPAVDEGAIRRARPREARPEHTLVLGWNARGPEVVAELDAYVAPGSTLRVVDARPRMEEQVRSAAGRLHGPARQRVDFRVGDPRDRRTLDALELGSYDRVLILASDGAHPETSDADTLVTLLHLRDIADRAACHFSIVSEMLDIRNSTLASVTRADDFIVSERLVSLMLAQLSVNPELSTVYDILFAASGCEIYLKPAADFVALDHPVDFETVVESARRQRQVAIGYRLPGHPEYGGSHVGVCVNPPRLQRISFTERDRVIVIGDE